jgi:hypothetical protein
MACEIGILFLLFYLKKTPLAEARDPTDYFSLRTPLNGLSFDVFTFMNWPLLEFRFTH